MSDGPNDRDAEVSKSWMVRSSRSLSVSSEFSAGSRKTVSVFELMFHDVGSDYQMESSSSERRRLTPQAMTATITTTRRAIIA